MTGPELPLFRRATRGAAALPLLLAVCGGRAVAIGGSTGESGSGESGGPGSTDEAGSETSEGEACPEGGASPELTLDLSSWPDSGELDWPCTVLELSNEGHARSLALACDASGLPVDAALTVTADPPLAFPVDPGDAVRLRYRQTEPMWRNRWLRLDRATGGHLLSGLTADAFDVAFPGGTSVLPYPTTAEPGPCPPRDGGCGLVQSMALWMSVGGEGYRVLPFSQGNIGDVLPAIEVWVGQADSYDTSCEDSPDDWYEIFVVQDGPL